MLTVEQHASDDHLMILSCLLLHRWSITIFMIAIEKCPAGNRSQNAFVSEITYVHKNT